MLSDLTATLAELGDDRTTRAIVLTGAPPVFSAGADLGRGSDMPPPPGQFVRLFSRLAATLERLELPVVAALAMLERGYLPPMLFSSLAASVALMPMPPWWGRWFPWSMPQAVVGSFIGVGLPRPTLTAGSWLVAAGVFLTGMAVAIAYVDRADNAQ